MSSAERSKKWYDLHGKEYHRKRREKRTEKEKEKQREWNREWMKRNRERYNASKYIYRENLKRTAINIYSDGRCCCASCGETDIDVLCLDHINNNGSEHRKEIGIASRGRAGTATYAALIRENWPEGLQVLCANCNLKKEIELKRKNRMKNKFYKHYIEKGVMPSVEQDNITAQLRTEDLPVTNVSSN